MRKETRQLKKAAKTGGAAGTTHMSRSQMDHRAPWQKQVAQVPPVPRYEAGTDDYSEQRPDHLKGDRRADPSDVGQAPVSTDLTEDGDGDSGDSRSTGESSPEPAEEGTKASQ